MEPRRLLRLVIGGVILMNVVILVLVFFGRKRDQPPATLPGAAQTTNF